MRNQNPHNTILNIMKNTEPEMRYKGGNFNEWQKKAREKLIGLLGIDKIKRCNPDFKIEYIKEKQEYTEIRFTFQSEEGYYVPCVLRKPKTDKKLPVIICLQGHSTGMHISLGNPIYPGDEETISGGDRDFAVRIVKEGYCAIAVEQRAMGECGGTEHGPECYIPAMTSLLMGRTMIGERVWDIQRTIDVILDNFEFIDEKKIICMGQSGGGTTTFYSACIEERIAAAIPSCSICTYEASIAAMIHCSCNFVPGIRQYFDMCDLGLLIAPRALIIVSGKEDDIFPINQAQETADYIREIYKKQGAEDKFAHVVGEGGHRFYADDAWPVMNKIIDKI